MRRRYNYFRRIAEAAAQDRALRMIAALIALATPELTSAADPNLKATLSCELVDEGRRTKIPAKRVRLEAPVECKFSVAGTARPEPFAARLISRESAKVLRGLAPRRHHLFRGIDQFG